MNAQSIARAALLVLVAGALGLWAWSRFGPGPESPPAPAPPGAGAPMTGHVVLVTYFTDNVRCDSCRKIEALTRKTVTEKFAGALDDGKVVFQMINRDRPENAHFTGKYDIVSKTVVISDRWDGEERNWERMDGVWDHLDDPEAFVAYLATPITKYLGPS